MTTGERLRTLRKELGISADDVAKTLGVSRATIFRYEKGDIEKVPGSMLEPLSKILQTTPAYLMGWSEDPAVNLVTHTKELGEAVHIAQQVASTLTGAEGFDSETLTHPNVKRVLSVAQQATAAEILDATDYLEFQVKKRTK